MNPSNARRLSLALFAAASAAVSIVPDAALSATRTWMNAAGGNYYTNGNWSPSGEPGTADNALFDLNAAYTVSFSGVGQLNPNHVQLLVADDRPTFDLAGKTYIVTAPGSTSSQSIRVGDLGRPGFDSSHLTIRNGVLAGNSAAVGGAPLLGLGAGSITVSTGGVLTLSGLLIAGESSGDTGYLELNSGGDTSMNTAFLGFSAGGKGTAIVNGSGSTMNAPFTYVGWGGSGTMNVTGGGSVSSSQQAIIGAAVGAAGRVLIDGGGSSWVNTGSLMHVGGSGTGSLTISNGGFLSSPTPSIGDGTGSVGNALVTGVGSRWNAVGSSGSIGNYGAGSLTVAAGGSASFGGIVSIGRQLNSSGALTVSGNGSKYLGFSSIVGDRGTGMISVSSGGDATLFGYASIGFQSSGRGTVLVDGSGSKFAVETVLSLGGSGLGTLDLRNSGTGSASMMRVDSNGRMLISGGATANAVSELLVTSNGSVTINGGNLNAGQMFQHGAFTQTGGASSIGPVSGTSTISLGGAALFTADHIRLDTLVIGGNSTAAIRPDGADSGVSVLKNLAIGGSVGTWQGKLDLSDNDLVIDYGLSSPLATVIDQVRTARNNGAWDGNGITSTVAAADPAKTLGAIEGADYHSIHGASAPFSGQSVDDTSVLVKHTWYGDTDLNGSVDFDDYVHTDTGFNTSLGGWFNGDFDSNGVVDFDDYVLIDLGFNAQSGVLRFAVDFLSGDDRDRNRVIGTPALERVVEHFDRFGVEYAGHFLSAVPEPTGIILAGPAFLLATRRRRSIR